MIGLVLRKIFGTKNDRVVAALRPLVGRVNELESSLKALTDDALRAKTAELRERVLKGQPLSEVQP